MPNPFFGLFRGLRDALMQKPGAKPITPGFNPDAPPLTGYWNPDVLPALNPQRPPLAPNFDPAAALLRPPASMTPEAPPPHWYKNTPGRMVGGAPLQSAEEGDWLQERGMIRPGNDFSKKERLIEALKSGATGFLKATAETGNPRAGLGGLVAGAGFGAYDPRVGARGRYSMTEEPQLMARKQREQQEAEARAALENRQLDNQYRQAQIGRIDLQNQMDKAEEARRALEVEARTKRGGFIETSPGATIYDVNTGKSVFTAPGRPQAERSLSTSENLRRINAEEVAREGTPESIAQSSTEARRGETIASAPELFRSILQTGKKPDGEPATAQEVARAQSWLDKRMNQLYQQNLRHTRGVRERNKAKRVTGQTPAASQAQPKANLKDLEKLWR